MDFAAILSTPDARLNLGLVIFGVWQIAAMYWGQRMQKTLFQMHEKDDQKRHEEVSERLDKVEATINKVIETFWNRQAGRR